MKGPSLAYILAKDFLLVFLSGLVVSAWWLWAIGFLYLDVKRRRIAKRYPIRARATGYYGKPKRKMNAVLVALPFALFAVAILAAYVFSPGSPLPGFRATDPVEKKMSMAFAFLSILLSLLVTPVAWKVAVRPRLDRILERELREKVLAWEEQSSGET